MYCENTNCRRTGLTKSEVERDKNTNLILCLGCYALANPGWSPDTQQALALSPIAEPVPKLGYSLTVDSVRGISALLSYGDIGLELVVPRRTLRSALGA